ncbi:MAG: peptidoglycan DD-metalloendopeptidase family protein [Bacteroidales bacterium]|jgi:murein DD-endopeptidase MepM/ murein hydrolase activator NlpD|nr:peptidoglycan DD-metalloendopeptidase family protein [Bacteroidales bacterium]
MINLKSITKISFIILLCGVIPAVAFAQMNPNLQIKRIALIESQNDSIDLATAFWTDVLDEEDDDEIEDFFIEYESFDSETIHYPKVDFSNKKDTTFIPLLSGDEQYVHPCNCPVTSRFGVRRYRYHYGTDTRLRTGDPVYTVFDGVVRIARRSPSYGFLVVVRHTNGLETYYAHLSKLSVKSGQEIKAGELIGLGGNTGRSRGSHLHFEVRYLGAPLNPEDLICFEKGELRSSVLELSPHHFRYLEDVKKLQQAVFHTVKSGETLGAIARRYGTTVTAVCRLNGISSTAVIRVGQRLRVR